MFFFCFVFFFQDGEIGAENGGDNDADSSSSESGDLYDEGEITLAVEGAIT